jgi:peptide/nickel transport system permease protein
MARSDIALQPAGAPVEERRAPVATKDQRIFVASQWQLMWWRFRKHKVAVASAVVVL